ncbi:MAG: hypothetical protein JXR42_05005 [Gammaproteobacteria bacterium]|nr:hypothetical protein [Gammaproteobacteria bacterium]
MIRVLTVFFALIFLVGCVANAPSVTNERATYNAQLGLAYVQQNNFAKAKESLLLAMQQAPKNPLVIQSYAYFLEKTKQLTLAKIYYQKALNLAPANGAVLNNQGAFLCRQKKYRKGIKYLKKAASDINYAHANEAYRNAGFCAAMIPDKSLAKKFFKKVGK